MEDFSCGVRRRAAASLQLISGIGIFARGNSELEVKLLSREIVAVLLWKRCHVLTQVSNNLPWNGFNSSFQAMGFLVFLWPFFCHCRFFKGYKGDRRDSRSCGLQLHHSVAKLSLLHPNIHVVSSLISVAHCTDKIASHNLLNKLLKSTLPEIQQLHSWGPNYQMPGITGWEDILLPSH